MMQTYMQSLRTDADSEIQRKRVNPQLGDFHYLVESGDYEAYSAHFKPNDVIKEEYEVSMVEWGLKGVEWRLQGLGWIIRILLEDGSCGRYKGVSWIVPVEMYGNSNQVL